MKITLHKVLAAPFQHPEYVVEETGEIPYCVVYLSEVDGVMEETEMLYDTLDEAYKESVIVSSTFDGITLEQGDVHDA